MPLDDPAGDAAGGAALVKLSCDVERTQLARRSSDAALLSALIGDAAPPGKRRTTCEDPEAVARGTGPGSDPPPPPPRVDSDEDVTEVGMLVACDSAKLVVALRALVGRGGSSWSLARGATSTRTAARSLSSRSDSIMPSASSASTSSRLLLLRRNIGGRCILLWASVAEVAPPAGAGVGASPLPLPLLLLPAPLAAADVDGESRRSSHERLSCSEATRSGESGLGSVAHDAAADADEEREVSSAVGDVRSCEVLAVGSMCCLSCPVSYSIRASSESGTHTLTHRVGRSALGERRGARTRRRREGGRELSGAELLLTVNLVDGRAQRTEEELHVVASGKLRVGRRGQGSKG